MWELRDDRVMSMKDALYFLPALSVAYCHSFALNVAALSDIDDEVEEDEEEEEEEGGEGEGEGEEEGEEEGGRGGEVDGGGMSFRTTICRADVRRSLSTRGCNVTPFILASRQ